MGNPVFRFKTADEFKEEFGEQWYYSSKIPCGWTEDMTVQLCGQPFDSEKFPTAENGNRVDYFEWSISKEMLTPLDVNDEKYKQILAEQQEHKLFLSRFTVSNDDYNSVFNFTYKEAYGSSFNIYISPTNNCQMLSVGSLENLLSRYSDIEKIKKILKVAISFTKQGKKLCMIDVHSKWVDAIKPLLYTPITQYKSTNGSSMAFGLIKLD